ncbi:serine/threonine protein kinase [Ktedonospora formicarum]|uniref:non-specific serine/threonine protein kinase n=1 Tax=Ktedonospora formicarum TaxID=2778364 RepID=A0A8J3HZI0_9CHLR|nr:serine/threonine-protein kinase [Ktedonospora formicarum]GHO43995.1 hypothetical protein KSX_21580 [Ktedonospora formicarum]
MYDIKNTIIAHYAIRQYLTKGGMSEIYLAHDLHTEQEVAIKLVHSSNQEYCQRFQREAQAIASLHHPHILPALDYGEFGPWCYLVTPYVAHGTLRDYIHHQPLSLEKAGIYLEQIASALQYAHDNGIIHRDIKASNIFMRNGQHTYLADFGLVKNLTDTSESLTESGYLIGTAEYMAPELAEEEATPASDLYSLGILLYQMLTGDVPFKGTSPVGTFMKHLSERAQLPSRRNHAIPKEIERVVMRAMAKEPHSRYQSAIEFSSAYRQALTNFNERQATTEQTLTTVTMPQTEVPIFLTSAGTKLREHSRSTLAITMMVPLLLGLSIYMLLGTNMTPAQSLNATIVQPTAIPGASIHASSKDTSNNHQSAAGSNFQKSEESAPPGPASPAIHKGKDQEEKGDNPKKKGGPSHDKGKPKP